MVVGKSSSINFIERDFSSSRALSKSGLAFLFEERHYRPIGRCCWMPNAAPSTHTPSQSPNISYRRVGHGDLNTDRERAGVCLRDRSVSGKSASAHCRHPHGGAKPTNFIPFLSFISFLRYIPVYEHPPPPEQRQSFDIPTKKKEQKQQLFITPLVRLALFDVSF